MLRTLIIDDEAHIRDTLQKLLARHCPQVSVVGEAAGVSEGINAIQELHPDLVLLDINMGDGSGFDLLQALPSINFNVIFVSASDKRTIQAFRLSGVEYLMKPVSPVELMGAVNNAEASDPRDLALKLEALEANVK
ncbi:MAG: response regulator [Bacteroidales bacterium]|nr:response regulator [Bacteroidales bacterium]